MDTWVEITHRVLKSIRHADHDHDHLTRWQPEMLQLRSSQLPLLLIVQAKDIWLKALICPVVPEFMLPASLRGICGR